ncbi:GDSL-type esterase/lipase family protein [Cerasicoccus arenae]|nr:GDSL-type esterase/lipase family protein [Cerasicoccus arenae]MBK1858118.1 hypothetical protein [Cerasicoccus arenae]
MDTKKSTVCLLFISSITFCLAADNLVQNPSFEASDPKTKVRYYGMYFPTPPASNPMGLVKGSPSVIAQDETEAHSGEYSLRLSSDEPVRLAVNQSRMPFLPGQTLRFSGWMKGKDLNPRGKSPGAVARLGFGNTEDTQAQKKAYAQSGFLKSASNTFDWEYFSTEVIVPEEANRMILDLFLFESSGTVWFDDLSVVVIDGPENAADSLPDPDQLRRYEEENANLAAPAPGEQRVVFYGDSITDIWKLDDYFPEEGFINRGIGGQDTSQMRARLEQDVLALQPSVVWFLGGTNDIAKGYSNQAVLDNVRAMAVRCKEQGIKLIICSILPISDYHKDREARLERSELRPPERILKINEGLSRIATEEDAVYLDLFSLMVDENGQLPADLANDGLHPNDKGYDIMAPQVLKAVNKAKVGN